MNNENAKVFATAAAHKVQKANAIGSKTTWTTEDHLRAMAKCLADAEPKDGVQVEQQYYDIIQDCYNVSAFAQWLEKKFQGTGHFVRKDGKAKTVSALDAELDALLKAQQS